MRARRSRSATRLLPPGEGQGVRALCLLAGGFAALACHKLVFLPAAIFVCQAMRDERLARSPPLLRAALHPVVLGFAAGHPALLDLWTGDQPGRLLAGPRPHAPPGPHHAPQSAWISRLSQPHRSVVGILLAHGLPAAAAGHRSRSASSGGIAGRRRTACSPAVRDALPRLDCVDGPLSAAFTLIDWRQTKHLCPLLLPLVMAPAAWAGTSRAARFVVVAVHGCACCSGISARSHAWPPTSPASTSRPTGNRRAPGNSARQPCSSNFTALAGRRWPPALRRRIVACRRERSACRCWMRVASTPLARGILPRRACWPPWSWPRGPRCCSASRRGGWARWPSPHVSPARSHGPRLEPGRQHGRARDRLFHPAAYHRHRPREFSCRLALVDRAAGVPAGRRSGVGTVGTRCEPRPTRHAAARCWQSLAHRTASSRPSSALPPWPLASCSSTAKSSCNASTATAPSWTNWPAASASTCCRTGRSSPRASSARPWSIPW